MNEANEVMTAEAPQVVITEAEVTKSETASKREAEITNLVIDGERKKMSVVPYVAASDCPPLGTAIPLKLAYSTIYSLNTLEERLGMTATEYVKEKLHYNSRLFVCNSFAAEQVDALALAIYQIEHGKAFILGDFAGIGKGRVNAGLLRYAYHHNLIPVFVTKSETLFTDIYNDFYDIGGFDNVFESVKNLPKPFVINGGAEIMSPVKNETGETDVLFSAYRRNETISFCAEGKVPKGHKIVLLTYSQISGETEKTKDRNKKTIIEFLVKIAPKALFVLDESHCASGEKSWIGTHFKRILDVVHSCTFSSATYAKSPNTMRFYAAKTDLSDSPVSMDKIVEAAKSNGEVIQEYIANKLVRNGQMIRRERSYDGCDINSAFLGLGEEQKKKYFDIYDNMILAFNKVHELKFSQYIQKAVDAAIKHHATKEGVRVVVKPTFGNDKRGQEEKKAWEEANAKNYLAFFLNSETTGSGRSQWVAALLFSLKADFVTEQALEAMRTKYKVEYVEAGVTSTKEVNRKPVIFLKSTGNALLTRLGYSAGMVLTKEQGDFSQSLVDLLGRLVVAKMKFRRVDNNTDSDIDIDNVDITPFLDDKGETIEKTKGDFRNIYAGIPLSPIDYIITKLQNEKRADWDTGYSSSPTYLVEDTTKRAIQIVQREDGKYDVINKPDEKATQKFARFNNGTSDVVIINAAGSTGISIHSKFSFRDKRQRIALIHEVELDVNTEVQKRGRINRSGQVCKPAYRYIVTVIPSETRRLISLSRKLRSLDANTSGNMKQSAKMSSFVGSDGNPIEDIFNKYGYQALQEFCALSENSDFKDMLETYQENARRYNGTEEEKLTQFTGKIETIVCERQEHFYNGINSVYLEIKKRNEENDTWDLDLDVADLRAATRTKKLLMKGEGKSLFSGNVYFEDKYTSVIVKTLPKDMVEVTAKNLAQKLDAKSKTLVEARESFIKQYKDYIEYSVQHQLNAIPVPHRGDYARGKDGAQDFEQGKADYEYRKQELEDAIRKEKNEVANMMSSFVPMMPTMIYADVMGARAYIDKYITDNERYDIREFHREFALAFSSSPGRFLGIKNYSKEKDNLISSNIAFVFAPLNTKSEIIEIKPTALEIILLKFILRTNEWALEMKIPAINEWKIAGRLRENSRMLTGDLLSALSVADEIMQGEAYSPRKQIIQFTNIDGSTDSAIRLFPTSGTKFKPMVSEKAIDINSREFSEYLEDHERVEVVIGNNYFVYSDGDYDIGISGEGNKYQSQYNNDKLLKSIEEETGSEFVVDVNSIKLPADDSSQTHEFHILRVGSRSRFLEATELMYKHSVASVSVDEEADVAQIAAINSEEFVDFIMSPDPPEGRGEYIFITEGDFVQENYYSNKKNFYVTVKPKNKAGFLSKPENVMHLTTLIGDYEPITTRVSYPDSSGRNTTAALYKFTLEDKEKAKLLMDYIFSVEKIYRPLGKGQYAIYKQEDIKGASEEKEKPGEYKYILTSPVTADNKHPEFIRQDKLSGTPYGIAITRYPLSVIECTQYGYVPYNIPINIAIKNLNGLLSTDENKNELHNFAQQNKTDFASVGRKAISLTKINMNFVFGSNSIIDVGKLIVAHYMPDKEAESEKRSDTKPQEKEAEPIKLTGLRDAENYLLKLKTLI